MRTNVALVTCMIIASVFACGLYYQQQEITSLKTRVAELEQARKMADPKNAWLLDTVTNLFTMGFHDANSVIARNHKRYLSKNGFSSYQSVLAELELVDKAVDFENMLAMKVENIEPTGVIEGKTYSKENISELSTYQLTGKLQYRGGRVAPDMPIKLILEIGKQRLNQEYPKPAFRYIITDIEVVGT